MGRWNHWCDSSNSHSRHFAFDPNCFKLTPPSRSLRGVAVLLDNCQARSMSLQVTPIQC
jgi:hypothetical protein